jgi:hypothetical protein
LYKVPTLETDITEPPQLIKRVEAKMSGTILIETIDPPSDGPPRGDINRDRELIS